MQRLRNQAACLEGQATRLGDLVVVPVPHVTELELQFLVLLLEAGNFAGRLGLGRLDSTLPANKRLLQIEYALAQQVVLGLCPCQLGLDDCGTQCLDLRVPLGAQARLPSCIASHDESHRIEF